MRLFHILAFDNVVQGTTTIYSNPLLARQLATADQLRLFATGEEVSGTSPTLTVQLEESADGVNFTSKYGTAEIVPQALGASGTTVLKGSDVGTEGSSGFVRARIALGGTSPAARIRLWITGRGSPLR